MIVMKIETAFDIGDVVEDGNGHRGFITELKFEMSLNGRKLEASTMYKFASVWRRENELKKMGHAIILKSRGGHY